MKNDSKKRNNTQQMMTGDVCVEFLEENNLSGGHGGSDVILCLLEQV
jgi:hypothetical protein